MGTNEKQVDPRNLHAKQLLAMIESPVRGLARENYTPFLASANNFMVRKLSSPSFDLFVGWDDKGNNDIQAFYLHDDFVGLHQELPLLAVVKLEKQEDHRYHIKEFGIDSTRMHTVESPRTVNLRAMEVESADVWTLLDCVACRVRQIKEEGVDWNFVLREGEKDFADHLVTIAGAWLSAAHREEQRPETPRTEAVDSSSDDSSSDDCSSSGTEELEMRG